ncbi:amino acid ABC transporter substrate-binding protein [Staphylococcus gallinarum]|uniref:Amino acid ABC transporter substrate-binding protein n=1 Tax=Staphylococcus gallinarum TaxID=1293 RepID=A0A380FKL2_STAGA|nr:amino acid ABC transporter substrate-binding protein [Staphylococcus gallinarum]
MVLVLENLIWESIGSLKTPEHEKNNFSIKMKPYSYALPLLVVNKDNNNIHSLDDLPGKRLTPMAPSGGLFSILTQYKQITSETNRYRYNSRTIQWR